MCLWRLTALKSSTTIRVPAETVNTDLFLRVFPDTSCAAGTDINAGDLPVGYECFAFTTGSGADKADPKYMRAFYAGTAEHIGDVVLSDTADPAIPVATTAVPQRNVTFNDNRTDIDLSDRSTWNNSNGVSCPTTSTVITLSGVADGKNYNVYQSATAAVATGILINNVTVSILFNNNYKNYNHPIIINQASTLTGTPPIELKGGANVTLMMSGGTSTLKNNSTTYGNNAGIAVPVGCTLTVLGSGALPTLTVQGGKGGAGIGGGVGAHSTTGRGGDAVKIYIHDDANVTAVCGNLGGAGIGGGYAAQITTITILAVAAVLS